MPILFDEQFGMQVKNIRKLNRYNHFFTILAFCHSGMLLYCCSMYQSIQDTIIKKNVDLENGTYIRASITEGIEAHKAGKVQEADQYYTAILKAQPKHPDANHNMGVLAVGVGKVEVALPFFKTALEVTNPSTVQFWISYIDALIKLDRIEDAKAVFEQAKSKGLKGDALIS